MESSSPTPGIGAIARAMRLMFGMAGVGISAWAIIVPYTKMRFHLADGTLGLMLLAGGAGGLLVMPVAGLAVARWGSRAVIACVGVFFGLLLPLLAVAPSPLGFTLLLSTYGALFGALDVALNAQGAAVERRSARLQMSGFHACYSIGSLGVALAWSLLLRLGLDNAGCAALGGGVILLLLTQSAGLLPRAADRPAGAASFALPGRATLTLGLCCFVCFLTEGAATDWSTIFLRFSRGMPLADAALGYAAYAVATALARLSGDAVAMRLGQAALMRLGCVLAATGIGLVILVPSGIAGMIGFGLVGLGTGNIAPLVLSAAARLGGVPAVVGLGYAGFLIGPVCIGLIASHFGLAAAFALNGVLLLAIFFAARAVAR
jgi:hypothetical protein